MKCADVKDANGVDAILDEDAACAYGSRGVGGWEQCKGETVGWSELEFLGGCSEWTREEGECVQVVC